MPLRYIPAVIIFIGLCLSTAYLYSQEARFIEGMTVTEGAVIGFGDKSSSSTTINGNTESENTQPLVEYSVRGDKYISEGRALGLPKWELGQTARIYYRESSPEVSRIGRFDELYFYTLLSGFFLIAITFFGLLNFVVYKVRGKPLS